MGHHTLALPSGCKSLDGGSRDLVISLSIAELSAHSWDFSAPLFKNEPTMLPLLLFLGVPVLLPIHLLWKVPPSPILCRLSFVS